MKQECRHYNTLRNTRCHAGVDYDSVRDTSASPYQWPCLRWSGARECKTTCEKRELMTAEDHAKREAEIKAIVEAAIAGKCPTCGAVCDKQNSSRVVILVCKTHGVVSRGCKRIGVEE